MSIKKVLLAGIAGGVAAFLLGWLIYGILLKNVMAECTNTSMMRAETDMVWWALIASNLFWGILLAYIFNRWANISTALAGLAGGAIINLLIGLSYSLSFYSMTTMYKDMTGLVIDVAAGTAMGALVGAVVGFVLGKIKD
jgi:uncharacterized protein with PQ loop repeat